MRWAEHRGVELMPGTPVQIEALLNKLGKRGWEFMSFGDRRNEKGKVMPGVVVWVRRVKMPGHG